MLWPTPAAADVKAALARLRARHLTPRPYTPTTNGKTERFIQTALREYLYAKPYHSSAQRSADMARWLHWYKHLRTHAGIKPQTDRAYVEGDATEHIAAGMCPSGLPAAVAS